MEVTIQECEQFMMVKAQIYLMAGKTKKPAILDSFREEDTADPCAIGRVLADRRREPAAGDFGQALTVTKRRVGWIGGRAVSKT